MMKLSQEKRLQIIDTLLPMQASIKNKVKVGDIIKFRYVHGKIKINGKGIVIRINDKGISKGIKVFCKKDNMIANLYYADKSLSIELMLSSKKRTKKSHLNHIINK